MTLTAGVMVRGLNLMLQILRMLMQWQQFKYRCLKIVMNSVSEQCLDLHNDISVVFFVINFRKYFYSDNRFLGL
jgi:hypothetical protein